MKNGRKGKIKGVKYRQKKDTTESLVNIDVAINRRKFNKTLTQINKIIIVSYSYFPIYKIVEVGLIFIIVSERGVL